MKIRDRIALRLSLTALLAVAGLGASIYFFSSRFHRAEFYSRLEERVKISEQMLLENDASLEQAVRERFLQRLDEEKEYAIPLDKNGRDSLDWKFDKGLSVAVESDRFVRFWSGEREQGIAKKYSLPKGDFAVVVTAVDVFGQTKLRHLRRILFAGVLSCVVILVLVSWFTTRRLLRPLEDKIHRATKISANRLDLRLPVENPTDELGELAVAFNGMLDRLQVAFESQKNFVAYASHEIRNPLTAIIGECEVLLEKPRTGNEYQEALSVVVQEAERLELLTKQLLELAKAESLKTLPNPEAFPIDLCLLEAVEKFAFKRLNINILTQENEANVTGSYTLLHTALFNLLDNALKYSGVQNVQVELSRQANKLILKIADKGIGIPREDMPNIYQPLQRSRNARGIRGHGIGLPLAKRIIELHGGQLEIRSEENEGTEVVATLPVA